MKNGCVNTLNIDNGTQCMYSNKILLHYIVMHGFA